MSPIDELKKLTDRRLETLEMFVAISTALGFVATIAATGFAMWTKFGGGDHLADAFLTLMAAALIAWIRFGLMNACARQKVRVEEVNALHKAQGPRGGGCLA